MLSATFLHRDDMLCGFDLNGHCGGEAGRDILCAAVSSAAYMTANTLTDVCNLDADISEQDGHLKICLSTEDMKQAQIILNGFYLHMKQLHEQFPDRIDLNNTEV